VTWDAAECAWDTAPNAWESSDGPCASTTTTEPTGRLVVGPAWTGQATGGSYGGSVGSE
jgi:hypothetical protein